MFRRFSLRYTILIVSVCGLFIISSLLTFTPVEKHSVKSNNSLVDNVTFASSRTNRTFNTKSVPKTTIKNIIPKYIYPYKFISTPSKVCSPDESSDPFLLILVKSNVRNLDTRIAIRSTWGNISDSSVKVVFLLGYSPFLQDFIDMEKSLYNDIVQEEFLDNYNNNTLKTVMGFNWSVTYCQKTKFFYFVDDDYLVNIRFLLSHLRKFPPDISIFTGCVWTNAKPNRNKQKRWYVSKTDYPGEVWPPYATGGSMVISYDYASKMNDGFKTIKPLYIDDVYLGIVAKELKIKLTNDGRFHPYYRLDKIQRMFSIHHFQSPRKLLNDWNILKTKLKV